VIGKLKLATLGFRDLALGWYRASSLRRSWLKASDRARWEWAAWSHFYLSGETSVGEMTVPDGVWTPIMSLPILLHGDVEGTNDAYGLVVTMHGKWYPSLSIHMFSHSHLIAYYWFIEWEGVATDIVAMFLTMCSTPYSTNTYSKQFRRSIDV
jgi:hypothetical protein